MAKPITVLITGDTSGLSKAVGQADGMFGKLGAAGGAAALAIGSAAVSLSVSVCKRTKCAAISLRVRALVATL